jgi:diguanylate cyclase (GGDEF)-like protein
MNTLQESALKDSLTGLYNRRFLQEYTETLIAGVLRRGKSVGLMMCDLDFFKQVNDLYGHNVGDNVLKETCEIIKKCIRSSDLVIRFGGEEFLVLMLDINGGETSQIADKIRETIEKTKIKVSDGVIKKTISIGISEFPTDAENFWQAIQFADAALYRAKDSGRNKVVRFTPDMSTEKGL